MKFSNLTVAQLIAQEKFANNNLGLDFLYYAKLIWMRVGQDFHHESQFDGGLAMSEDLEQFLKALPANHPAAKYHLDNFVHGEILQAKVALADPTNSRTKTVLLKALRHALKEPDKMTHTPGVPNSLYRNSLHLTAPDADRYYRSITSDASWNSIGILDDTKRDAAGEELDGTYRAMYTPGQGRMILTISEMMDGETCRLALPAKRVLPPLYCVSLVDRASSIIGSNPWLLDMKPQEAAKDFLLLLAQEFRKLGDRDGPGIFVAAELIGMFTRDNVRGTLGISSANASGSTGHGN